MRILKTFTLRWWETGLFKLAMLSLGITIGATWPALIIPLRPLLLLLFIPSAAYVSWIWWKQ